MSAATERRFRGLVLVCSIAAILLSGSLALGMDTRRGSVRQPADDAPAADPDAALEGYFERLGLRTLLADHLAARIPRTTGPERKALAERLARIYVDLLSAARDPAERQHWETRSRDLLRSVPEAEGYELRLNLARVVYITAEEIVERGRLRLASDADLLEAERILRGIAPELSEIAARLNARVETLERQEERGNDSDILAQELAEARRLRSLAYYYAGWTEYSLAYLTGADRHAQNALRNFGWILNSRGGVVATLERLPTGLLRYEHIARAALGCALCASARGNDVEAIRWLDTVAQQADLAPPVREQLLPRRISILAAARRWADLERTIRVTRRSDRTGGGTNVQPLGVVPARLLAVVTLEADRKIGGDILDQLAAIALQDLVTRGEVAQVLDLVQRYGTAPIGDTGFVVNYVRGMQAYEQAREAHRQTSENIEEPVADRAVADKYRSASRLLDAALREPDAANFGNERSKAAMLVGLAMFYAGDVLQAADRFLQSARAAATPAQGEEPLWLAVVALDRAVRDGKADVAPRRAETAALFLQTYPQSPRAARLLVSLGASGLLEEESAVRILLGVPKDAPMYESARREAARLLYGLYRRARAGEKDFAATRFVGVAEEVLAMDRRACLQGSGEEAREAAERAVLRVRQILDAVLSASSPDLARAEAAIQVLDEVVAVGALDISGHAAELTFRRIQILMARQQHEEAEQLAATLEAQQGPFADAARRLLFRSAQTALDRADRRGDADAAREALRNIIRHGQRILEAQRSSASDSVTLSISTSVAEAAMKLWQMDNEDDMRRLALAMDEAVLETAPRNEASLRRVATVTEAAGDTERALECWRILLSGFQAGSNSWYEARYHSIRLLALLDRPRAVEAMRQHRILYPSLGPPPWDAQFLELERQLGGGSPEAALPQDPAAGGRQGGGS